MANCMINCDVSWWNKELDKFRADARRLFNSCKRTNDKHPL